MMVHLAPLAYPTHTMNDTVSTQKLPSFNSVCQEMMEQPLRHHFRARSLPTALPPSMATAKREAQSSMDVLLKAIALDEKMGSKYKQERVKNFVREQQRLHQIQVNAPFKPRHHADIRRRSRSAPGAPMAHYYHHVAFNTTRWYLPNHDDQDAYHDSHDIAYSLVQQHLKSTTAAFKK